MRQFFIVLAVCYSACVYGADLSYPVNEQELGYRPDRIVPANNCEFFINAFGVNGTQYEYHAMGYSFFQAFFSVNTKSLIDEEKGQIRNVGINAHFVEETRNDTSHTDDEQLVSGFFLATPVENRADYYEVDVISRSNYSDVFKERTFFKMQFFVDIQRQNGQIERVILPGSKRYVSMAEIVGSYPLTEPRPETRYVQYIEGDSPIFYQKKACNH